MSEINVFKNFILNKNFSKVEINNIKELLQLNSKQLIRKSFKYLNSYIGKIQNNDYYFELINNCVELIFILCDEEEFNDEEVKVNRLRIKKARESILAYSNKFNSDSLLMSANKLDEIILNKNIDVSKLIILIKKLIDQKEDVNIIKKLLNTNKGAILLKNNELFDYTFNYALESILLNEPSIYYYIALLKIFYSINIDKNYYIKELNKYTDDTNEFSNEIYLILHGVKRGLNTNEILNKYGMFTSLDDYEFNIPKSDYLSNSSIITIDSNKTRVRDDAISIKKDGNNYIIELFITDPAKYIDFNSEIDIKSRNNYKNFNNVSRLFSPEIEDTFSLNKELDKPVLSLTIIMDNTGNIKDYYLKEKVIKIDDNLSFSDCDLIIEGKKASDYKKSLTQLYDIALLLENKNKRKIDYWNKKESDSLSKKITNHKSDKIVSELMVLYNNLVATLACNNNIPYVYRTQNKPYLKKLISDLGIPTNETIDKVVDSIYLTSKYSYVPMYHYGLNLKIYSHSSDALRRYPDLYNEYLLHNFYFKDKNYNIEYDDYINMINYFNQRSMELSLMRSEYNRALKIQKKD